MKTPLLCSLLLLAAVLTLPAQDDGRISEKKIKEQELFIEAQKFRLLGNLDKAAELFREVLDKDRQNAAAAYELARIYADQNKNDEALNFGRQAVTRAPQNPWYKKFLADICQRNNLFQEAAKLYEQLAAAYPNEDYNHYKWAYFLVLAGQPDQALQVYANLEQRIGVNEELSRRKHSLYLGIGETAKAGQELERLCQTFPGNTEYLHLLAGFYGQTNNPQAEKETYQKILQIDPNDSKAFFAVNKSGSGDAAFLNSLDPVFKNPGADLDEKIKQLIPYVEKAAATNDQALAGELLRLALLLDEAHPNQAKVHALNGDLLYLTGDNDKAIERYKQALRLDASVFSVWEQLFLLSLETGDYKTLADYTEKAMDYFPNQAKVYYYNGLGWRLQEDYARAVPPLEQAVLMAGRNTALKIQINSELGRALYKQKKYDQAAKRLQNALELSGEADAPALEYYGDLLFQQNRPEEAVKYWQKALDAGAASPTLQKKIADQKLYD
jgi:tetratricopeptide (TPR) repeat protein